MSVLRDLLKMTASGHLRSTASLCSSSSSSSSSSSLPRACLKAHEKRCRWRCAVRAVDLTSHCSRQQSHLSNFELASCGIRLIGHTGPNHRRLISCSATHSTAKQNGPSDDEIQALDAAEMGDQDGTEDDNFDEEEIQEMLEENESSQGAVTDTANTEWGKQALLVVQKVLQQADMQELALFSLIASPSHKQLKIRLDKPTDEYGSPSLDEIAVFSRQFSDEYHNAIGEQAEDIAVEISSPGAERQVRVPQDLLRFQHLPMLVTFQLQDSQKTDTKVFQLAIYNEGEDAAEWQLADVRQNRSGKGVSKLSKKQAGQRWKVSFDNLHKVNLYLEV